MPKNCNYSSGKFISALYKTPFKKINVVLHLKLKRIWDLKKLQ